MSLPATSDRRPMSGRASPLPCGLSSSGRPRGSRRGSPRPPGGWRRQPTASRPRRRGRRWPYRAPSSAPERSTRVARTAAPSADHSGSVRYTPVKHRGEHCERTGGDFEPPQPAAVEAVAGRVGHGQKRRSAPSSSCLRHVAKGPRQLARAWARDRWPSGSASAEHPECRGSRRSGALEYHGGSFGELASPPRCVALRGHVVPYRGVDALSCDRFRANCGSVARRSRSTPRPGRWAAAPDMMQVSNRRLPDGFSNRLHGSVSVIGATEWLGAFPPWLPGSAPPRQPLPLLGSSNAQLSRHDPRIGPCRHRLARPGRPEASPSSPTRSWPWPPDGRSSSASAGGACEYRLPADP